MNQILQNGTIVLGSAQALDFLVNKIVNFVNFIKKTKIVKNTIDDFSYDVYFSGFNNINIDEKEIKSLLNGCDKTIQINEFKNLLKDYFVQKGVLGSAAESLTKMFLASYFDNLNDDNKAALCKVICDIDDIKTLLKCIDKKIEHIKNIDDIENKLKTDLRKDAEINDFDLRYFEIDDSNFISRFRGFVNNEYEKEINVACYSIEEGVYCILNYLKYTAKINNVYVIDDESTWNSLNEEDIQGAILLPNFLAKNIYKKYKNVKHVFIYNKDSSFISGETIDLRKRTIIKLTCILQDKYKLSYDVAHRFCIETNGNYYLVKNRLFSVHEEKFADKSEKKELFSLFLINSFGNSSQSKEFIKNCFDLDYDNVIDGILSKECYKKYFKKYDRYGITSVELLDAFSVWGKYELYKDIFIKEKITNTIYSIVRNIQLDNSNVYIGFIKSLIIYKAFNNTISNYEFDNFTNQIISLIKTQNDWKNSKNILNYLVELSPDIIIKRIIDEFNGNTNSGLVNFFEKNKEDQFYIDILWMLEKSFYLINDKKLSFEALFGIFSKNFEYTMNNPKDILRKLVFPGINSPVDFNVTKKTFDEMIDKYKDINIWDVFYENVSGGIAYSWAKPKVYYCEEEYVNDIKETWLYCFNKLEQLDKDCKKTINWIKIILNSYHTLSNHIAIITNTISGLCNKDDINKFYIKYNLLQLLYNYNFFDNEGMWDIDENSKNFIKKLIEDIQFQNKYYDSLLHFQNDNNYNLIEPVKINSVNHMEENRNLAAIDKKKYFDDNSKLDIKIIVDLYKTVIQSVEFNQYDFQIGQDLAEYIDNKKFNKTTFKILINEFLEPDNFHREIFDYIYTIDLDVETIENIKKVYLDRNFNNIKFYIRLLNFIFRINGNIVFLENENNEIKEMFWKDFDGHIQMNENNHQVVIDILENLLVHENFSAYISIIDFNKKLFDFNELKELILKLSKNTELDINNSYALSDLLEYLYKNKFEDIKNDIEYLTQLSHIELDILGEYHNCSYKWTQYLFENNPEVYAEFVIKYDPRLDDKNKEKFVNRILRYNGFAYRLNLNKLNEAEFEKWDQSFKNHLSNSINDKNKCKEIYYENIGSIIGLSDIDIDGAFPKIHYRKYVEDNYNEELFNSIVQTKYSKRGMYTPKQGEYNYSVVDFFNKCIEKCIGCKNTTIVLTRLRNQFLDDAERERELSENEEF